MPKPIAVYSAALLAAVVWFGLGLQFWLLVETQGTLTAAARSFFSFFTILSNLIVALALTVPLIASGAGEWFRSPNVRSAVAVYIVVVGIVYALVLRATWNPQGLQAVADRVLHDAVPVLYFAFWLTLVPKGSLRLSHVPAWLIFPLAYLAIRLILGSFTGWYPYPFLDVAQHGGGRVAVNSIALIVGFLLLGALVVGVDQILGRRATAAD